MKRLLRWMVGGCLVLVGLTVLSVLAGGLWLHRATGASMGPREVLAYRVKLVFKGLTGRSLPKRAARMQAITSSGRGDAIFVRFGTDAEGMEYVLETFGGAENDPAALDSNGLAELKGSNISVFAEAAGWQDELGLALYDQASLESACLFESELEGTCYKVLIDRQSGTVYLFADAR